jgi:hypothetical protein
VFLKHATARAPVAVVELVKHRFSEATRLKDWRWSVLWHVQGEPGGYGLLKVSDGTTYLVQLLDWALGRVPDPGIGMDFGKAVYALCGEFTPEANDAMLEWMRGGTERHVRVVSAVLREVAKKFVFQHSEFVRDVLYAAAAIGAEAQRLVTSSLYAATFSGGRSGAPGEPFKEDLDLRDHASCVLA